jgi:hypothetical protein
MVRRKTFFKWPMTRPEIPAHLEENERSTLSIYMLDTTGADTIEDCFGGIHDTIMVCVGYEWRKTETRVAHHAQRIELSCTRINP